jgi:glucan phosphoethanolaminetransferase (alkaline phosphatase superfamily)
VISLFPLRFLPGHKLHSWHKGAWLATFSLTLFVLVQVLLRPHSSSSGGSHAPLITTLALFVLFGASSVVFRQHFAKKHRHEPQTAATALGPAPAEGQSQPAKSEGRPAS